jgi:hypothetical protein
MSKRAALALCLFAVVVTLAMLMFWESSDCAHWPFSPECSAVRSR